MMHMARILVRAIVLAGCAVGGAGCGQKGVLFLPTEPAAAHRATLPQSLRPFATTPAPATGASSANPATPATAASATQ